MKGSLNDPFLQKYCVYRERLGRQFLVSGVGPGMGLPADTYMTKGGLLRFGDGGINLGWRLATLAAELRLGRSAPGASGVETETSCADLYETLLALGRLLQTPGATLAALFPGCNAPMSSYSSGFFIRDDAPADLAQRFSNVTAIDSDYVSPAVFNKEESQDQVYHVLMGLAAVHKLVPNESYKGLTFGTVAAAHASEIVAWIAENSWQIYNPACGRPVQRGAQTMAYSAGLYRLLTSLNAVGAVPAPIEYEAPWTLLATPVGIEGLAAHPDNLHMAMALGAAGDGWGETTSDTLAQMSDKEHWIVYPLLHAILYERRDRLPDLILQSLSLLATAPPEGPSAVGPAGWFASNRFLRDRKAQNSLDPRALAEGAECNGLDFMLLHNLFCLAQLDE
jgi:hypothetical protein